MKLRTLSIGELSDYIAQSINFDTILQNIYVEGEISNYKIHSSGNIYFTLKDETNKVKGIMFARSYDSLKEMEEISDGDHVTCKGSVSYYKKEGYISLVVTEIKKTGEGLAYQEFLQLKNKLEAQGLFDEKYKKKLPAFPNTIGIITSTTGAVIRDIYYVMNRRYPKVKLQVYPALMQGEGAAKTVVEGIEYFDSHNVDLIIIARGGGSYEELSAFNDETLAYTIFQSNIPIISAIGHETDFTISDFVADVRASTPSVAAEISVPSLHDVQQRLLTNQLQIREITNQILQGNDNKLGYYQKILDAYEPSKMFTSYDNLLDIKFNKIKSELSTILANKKAELEKRISVIFSKNPESIYEYGGAFVYDEMGKKITVTKEVSRGMSLDIHMKDGKFKVRVMEIE